MSTATSHKIAYPISLHDGCHGARIQAVSSADRPLCALVSARSARVDSQELRGTLTGLGAIEQLAAVDAEILSLGVPLARAETWSLALRGRKLTAATGKRIRGAATVGGITLDTYQENAVDKASCSGVVYSLDCGLGKTATAVATAITAFSAGYAKGTRCWIFCPLNAIGAWSRFAADLQSAFTEVRVLSMDSAHKYTGCDNSGGVIIFDEVHLLGEARARRTASCHQIRARFDYGICLTGTLLHGGVEKALSILDLAVPGGALFASRWAAGEHFHCLVKKKLGQRTVTSLEKPTAANKEAFIRYLSRLTVAMKKDHPEVRAAFQLPEQHIHEVRLGEPWVSLDDLATAQALKELAASGEVPSMQAVAHLCAREGSQAKVEWVLNELEDEAEDTQLVIFANYLDTLDAMQAGLEENGISFVRVDGSVTGPDRVLCQQRFQSGSVRVFLGQETAASTSMDLFAGRVSICLDHSWRATDYSQMLARTCRRGQQHETLHLDLVSNRFQAMVVERVRNAQDFDASVAEWQRMKSAVDWQREVNTGPATYDRAVADQQKGTTT